MFKWWNISFPDAVLNDVSASLTVDNDRNTIVLTIIVTIVLMAIIIVMLNCCSKLIWICLANWCNGWPRVIRMHGYCVAQLHFAVNYLNWGYYCLHTFGCTFNKQHWQELATCSFTHIGANHSAFLFVHVMLHPQRNCLIIVRGQPNAPMIWVSETRRIMLARIGCRTTVPKQCNPWDIRKNRKTSCCFIARHRASCANRFVSFYVFRLGVGSHNGLILSVWLWRQVCLRG